MTNTFKRTGAAVISLLLLCLLTLNAMAAAKLTVGVKFWKEKSDKESMANNGVDADREATLTRQSNGTYTLTLPVIGDMTYDGVSSGDFEKGTAVLTIKNLPSSILTGSDVNKSLVVTCNIQMDMSILGEINTTARMCIWTK